MKWFGGGETGVTRAVSPEPVRLVGGLERVRAQHESGSGEGGSWAIGGSGTTKEVLMQHADRFQRVVCGSIEVEVTGGSEKWSEVRGVGPVRARRGSYDRRGASDGSVRFVGMRWCGALRRSYSNIQVGIDTS